jgi:hypothetical protein
VGGGALWEGPTGNSANLGSMLVGDGIDAQPAFRVASIGALEQQLSVAGIPTGSGAVDEWDWAGFEPVLSDWLDASALALAKVIYNTTTVVECGMAIIDGTMPRPVVLRLVEKVGAHIRALPASAINPPQVLPGHLGALAPAIGAAELPLYRRYFSRTLADLAG